MSFNTVNTKLFFLKWKFKRLNSTASPLDYTISRNRICLSITQTHNKFLLYADPSLGICTFHCCPNESWYFQFAFISNADNRRSNWICTSYRYTIQHVNVLYSTEHNELVSSVLGERLVKKLYNSSAHSQTIV